MLRLRSVRGIRSDWGLFLVVVTLLIISLMMVYSATYHLDFESTGRNMPTTRFLLRHLVFIVLGLVCWWGALHVDYRFYQQRKVAVAIILLTILLQVPLVIMSLLSKDDTAYRQYGNSVQPSELVKLGAVVYIAVWLNAKRTEMRKIVWSLLPFLVLIAIVAAAILLQRHLSTTLLFVFTALAMFFAVGVDTKRSILLLAVVMVLLILVGLLLGPEYRLERLFTWKQGAFNDATDKGYQGVQTLVALNRGGMFGVGLGQSEQKFPIFAAHTDCIFAIIGEEFGYFGSLVIIALYGLWTWQGFRIARNAQDLYGRLVVIGIVSYITLQAIVHIGGNSGMAPFTGTVLPFVSYGGSSIVSCLAALGILMNIARGGGGLFQPRKVPQL
jgi:cell division protein FtsW